MNTAPIIRQVTIINERGLHARASAKFVKQVEAFNADVTVIKDDMTVPGGSIMSLLMLAAGPGSTLTIQATGAQAQAAVDALVTLVEDRFGEEQ
ncbi:MAG: HPr family phosphocarrier protein [Pseudomonadota bacterium]